MAKMCSGGCTIESAIDLMKLMRTLERLRQTTRRRSNGMAAEASSEVAYTRLEKDRCCDQQLLFPRGFARFQDSHVITRVFVVIVGNLSDKRRS